MQQSSGDMSSVTLEEQLETHWRVVYTNKKKHRVHYLSPEYKIPFLCKMVAYEFELHRQECNVNEGKSLSIFLKIKENAGRKVSDFIYGGRSAAELIVEWGGGEIGDSLGEELCEYRERW